VREQQRRQQVKASKRNLDGTSKDNGTTAAKSVTDGATEVVREMQKAFAVVFVDHSGVMNLAGRVSDSGWAELQQEARRSLALLHEHHHSSAGGGGVTSFGRLFLQRADFWMQYDQYAWIGPMPLDDTNAQAGPDHRC
jgi:class 3 adenylate cyclase